MASRLILPKQKNSMRAGLLSIIHHHCKMGNLSQTKMDVQLRSPLACMKMLLILVSLQTSNLFLANV